VKIEPAPELTVVVPTFNERDNVALLVEKLRHALVGIDWEIIFVDDNSPDGTAMAARAIGAADRRVRCIRRLHRRGLAGACLEGILSSQARWVAVMDADLQHDEMLLVAMLARIRAGDADLVIGSRYLDGGSADAFSKGRARISRWSNAITRKLLGIDLSDPMSGFFMIRREALEDIVPAISTHGFKILLDIVATARGQLRIVELPFAFRRRLHGETKLNARIMFDFVELVLAKLARNPDIARFLLFCLIGATGIVVHMAMLQITLGWGGLRFGIAQIVATIAAITWNFFLNNSLTYRDQRLVGWRLITGLVWFQVICAVGAISNIGIATWIYDFDIRWWLAGLAGALMSAAWNYMMSNIFVWHAR